MRESDLQLTRKKAYDANLQFLSPYPGGIDFFDKDRCIQEDQKTELAPRQPSGPS